jgi:alginate O-acetyltransferase complex protein AlgI
MLFTSWEFCAFLPIVFFLHYLRPSVTWQAAVLTLSSFVFYGWKIPALLPLLLVSTIVNAEAARCLIQPGKTERNRRSILFWALAFNLGALCFFKYAALVTHAILPLAFWQKWAAWAGEIPLPIGISFYTFQGISLVVDASRAKAGELHGLRAPVGTAEVLRFHEKVWFFKAFFPQLIAGPIVKAGQFLPQIAPKRLCDVEWDRAVRWLISGFFLKMVIADNLKEQTVSLSHEYAATITGGDALVLLYAYSIQIFADFCGYSLIALGLAKLFGYDLPINFLNPYLSRSITEFWQRWHLSLSSWLREYLYIPLGGNRFGEWRTYRNLFIVMFLGGLWHGAAWTYAAWGMAHGVLLAAERALGIGTKAEPRRPIRGLAEIARVFVIFTVVSILWLLFKFPSYSDVLLVLKAIATSPAKLNTTLLLQVSFFTLPVLCWQLRAARPDLQVPLRFARWADVALYGFMLWLICTNSGPTGDFIYFQF